MLPKLTILPLRRSIISGTTSRHTRRQVIRFRSSTALRSAYEMKTASFLGACHRRDARPLGSDITPSAIDQYVDATKVGPDLLCNLPDNFLISKIAMDRQDLHVMLSCDSMGHDIEGFGFIKSAGRKGLCRERQCSPQGLLST